MFEIKIQRGTFGILPHWNVEPSDYDAYSLDFLQEEFEELGFNNLDASIMQGYLSAG